VEHDVYEGLPEQTPLWTFATHPGQLQEPLVETHCWHDVTVAVPEHVPALPPSAPPLEPDPLLEPEPPEPVPDDPPELLAPEARHVPATHASPRLQAVPLQQASLGPPQPVAPSAPPSWPPEVVEFEPEQAPTRVKTRQRPASTTRMRFMELFPCSLVIACTSRSSGSSPRRASEETPPKPI
jgi:hypothetical protein